MVVEVDSVLVVEVVQEVIVHQVMAQVLYKDQYNIYGEVIQLQLELGELQVVVNLLMEVVVQIQF